MIPITIALIVVQEMCARMGVVTGKGLSDLIREEFGLRLTVRVMLLLVVVNYTNVVTEFIGIAGSLHLFHVTKFISVPLCAALVWFWWCVATYKSTEKSSSLLRSSISPTSLPACSGSAQLARGLRATVQLPRARCGATRPTSTWPSAWSAPPLLRGCSSTCSPRSWRREFGVKDYPASRLDVIIGSFFTDIIAWFIVVACAATLFTHGMGAIQVAADAAEAMRPLAGDYAFLLFAFGLFNASLFAASILPLSTAYTVCEGLGVESGVEQDLQGSALFLLALHAAHRRRGAHRAAAARRAADQRRHPLPGPERRPASRRHHSHADA
jgi:hypothetical protein